MSGEDIWRGLAALGGPSGEFGPQFVPDGEDVDYSRQDTGAGWDQALTMDRTPPAATSPISVLALPPPEYLALERNQGTPADLATPQFRESNLGDRFGSHLNLIEWCPYPEVMHEGGYTSAVREDVLPDAAKSMPDYYYGVIDSRALLDEAILRTRRAMYGR